MVRLSHTHNVYTGSREKEFVDKIKGLLYEEIVKCQSQEREREREREIIHQIPTEVGIFIYKLFNKFTIKPYTNFSKK